MLFAFFINEQEEIFMANVKNIEYMCSYCGQKAIRTVNGGRPTPGTCRRKSGNRPHSWIVNRRF